MKQKPTVMLPNGSVSHGQLAKSPEEQKPTIPFPDFAEIYERKGTTEERIELLEKRVEFLEKQAAAGRLNRRQAKNVVTKRKTKGKN